MAGRRRFRPTDNFNRIIQNQVVKHIESVAERAKQKNEKLIVLSLHSRSDLLSTDWHLPASHPHHLFTTNLRNAKGCRGKNLLPEKFSRSIRIKAGLAVRWPSQTMPAGLSDALSAIAESAADHWDLEAPGLHRFFHEKTGTPENLSRPGVINYFDEIYRKLELKSGLSATVAADQTGRAFTEAFPLDEYLIRDVVPRADLLKGRQLDAAITISE